MPENFAPNLGLPYGYSVGENGWGPSVSNGLKKLDALVNVSVISILTAPPSSPTNGDRHLVGVDATGAWVGKDNQIAVRIAGAWEYYAPPLVRTVHVQSLGYFLQWSGTAWVDIGLPDHGHAISDVSGLSSALGALDSAVAAKAPTDHDATHLPDGSDALNYGKILGYGTTLPTPGAAFANLIYFKTDENGGTPYQCRYVASAWTWVKAASGATEAGGGRPVAQTLDANHELVYTFSEASGAFANTGAQGTGQNIATIGTCLVRRGEQGIFGDCVRVTTPGSPLTGGTYNPPGGAFSVEVWFLPTAFPTNPMYLVNKSRLTSGQSGAASDTAIGLYVTNGRDLGLFIWAGGAMRSIVSVDAPVVQGAWHHLAGTFDGSTLRAYCNGVQVASGAYSGSVDYGAPGSWHFGTFPNLDSFGITGVLATVLVSSVARDAAYMKSAFRNGLPGITAAP